MDPFVGEIRLFSFQKVPVGWLACQGQVLQIQQYQALYSLLSIQYGGDGKTTFQLPDLRGRVPVHFGLNPVTQTVYKQGTMGGAEGVTLTALQMPEHTHTVNCYSTAGNTTNPNSAFPALLTLVGTSGVPVPSMYIPPGGGQTLVPLNTAALDSVGGGGAHENRQPYMAGNYCIATSGLYPSRN